jgi:hypothetical protein
MMNELQVNKSNIFHWVSYIRFPNRNNSPNHSMAMANDYEPRCETIRKKIRSLISAVDVATKKTNGSRLTIRIGTEIFKGDDILRELHSAIGVYNIRRWDENKTAKWANLKSRFQRLQPLTSYLLSTEWVDYLGDQSIRKGGGHIVVMLSDEGVKQLNEIAHALYPLVQSSSTV